MEKMMLVNAWCDAQGKGLQQEGFIHATKSGDMEVIRV